MRPSGDIRLALLNAASTMYRFEAEKLRGPTMAELAEKACVGKDAARQCVSNMKRAGELAIVHERVVDYRNRPVAEYAPAAAVESQRADVFADLNQCMADWVR